VLREALKKREFAFAVEWAIFAMVSNRALAPDSKRGVEEWVREDVALGYKQLMEVERAFRTLKTTLELRPLYHRKDERIQAHVLLCYLALLLVRISERETGETWARIRAVMKRCHLGEFSALLLTY
jgi:transposase